MAIGAVPLAAASVLGAAVSVLMGVPKEVDELLIASPEIAGAKTVLRTVFPPLVACLGVLPVLMSRNPPEGSTATDMAGTGALIVGVVVLLCAGWVRFAADIRAWWVEASQSAKDQAIGRTPEEEGS